LPPLPAIKSQKHIRYEICGPFIAIHKGVITDQGLKQGCLMRHFQDCIDNDSEPSPNVIDGAKACAVASAAWASPESGAVEKIFNDF